jgi:flagellar hook-length control protein FliK
VTLVGLFTGTAAATPPTGSASGLLAAAGFGTAMLDAQAALLPPVAPIGDAQAVEQPAVDLLSQLVAKLTGATSDAPAPDDHSKDESVPAPVLPLVPIAPSPTAAVPAATVATIASAVPPTSAASVAEPSVTATVVASTVGTAELAAAPVKGARLPTKAEAKPVAPTSTAVSAPAVAIIQVPVTPGPVTPAPVSLAPTPVPASLPASTTPMTVDVVTLPGSVPAKPVKAEAAPISVTAVSQDANAPASATIPVPAQPAVASAAPAAPTAPAPAQHFTVQLSKPIFTLASAGAGEHVVTVKVTPENLGPITVRAHVGVDGMRVELFAPSDVGRDAIRSILPDLRKDLAGQGLSANLDLSSQNQPSDRGFDGSRRERLVVELPESPTNTAVETDIAPVPTRARDARSTTLDVLV